MDAVVAPLLHSKAPVKPLAVSNDVLLQLLVTATVGAGTADPIGAATPLASGLVQLFSVCVTV